jgi:hypothetical protein
MYSMNYPKKLTLSLIFFQIILVISSPSSSTTGFLTLIFLIPDMFRRYVRCEFHWEAVGVNVALTNAFDLEPEIVWAERRED